MLNSAEEQDYQVFYWRERTFKPVHSYIIGTGGICFEDFLKTDVTEWIG